MTSELLRYIDELRSEDKLDYPTYVRLHDLAAESEDERVRLVASQAERLKAFDALVHPAGRLPDGGCSCAGEPDDPPCEFHAPVKETFDAKLVRDLCTALCSTAGTLAQAQRFIKMARAVLASERKP